VNSRTTRPRALLVAAIAALCFMAVGAAGAQAATKVKVTGGTTTVTPSAATNQFLANNGISVTALSPATLANGAVAFPIAGGRINPTNLHGFIVHRGGLRFTKGTKSLTLRHFLITSSNRGAFLDAARRARRCSLARRANRRGFTRRRVCFTRLEGVRVARLVNGQRHSDGSVTADLLLSRRAAGFINRLAGHQVVSAGANIGSAKIVATTA
jgi:hypothetical protein